MAVLVPQLLILSGALLALGTLEYWFSRDVGQRRKTAPIAIGIAILLFGVLSYSPRPPDEPLTSLYTYCVVPIVWMLCWKTATKNYDFRAKYHNLPLRLCLCTAAVGIVVRESMLPFFLLCFVFFDIWTHHLLLPLRLVLAYLSGRIATTLVGGILGLDQMRHSTETVMVLMAAVHLSHYVVPGVSKLALGRKPWSWIMKNQTHLILPAAYTWGWLRWIKIQSIFRTAALLSHLDPLLNLQVVLAECCCLLALTSRWAYAGVCLFFILFHLAIFSLSGICFWEYAVTNLILATWLIYGRLSTTIPFGRKAFLLGSALVLLFPVRKLVWKPHRLAWWETPLINLVSIQAVGASGAIYGIYNDFFCPHEREFGRTPIRFVVPSAFLTGHLGQVDDERLRDHIIRASGDPQEIRSLVTRQGTSSYKYEKTLEFKEELVRVFGAHNRQQSINPLPIWLRGLKAPGGHFYYWGKHPRYAQQEHIVRLRVVYEEMLLTTNSIIDLDLVSALDILLDCNDGNS